MIGRKNFYGSGSVTSARLAGRVWTITATAERAGLNPLTYLTAYLDACAHNSATAPTGEALTRFLPWAATPDDLTAWSHGHRPHPDHEPATTTPDHTGNHTDPPSDLHTGPAP